MLSTFFKNDVLCSGMYLSYSYFLLNGVVVQKLFNVFIEDPS